MTALFIDDFKLGLDTRKSVLTGEPGSLRVADNVVITSGGEVRKRMAFVPVGTLPAGQTQGLHGTTTGGDGTEEVYAFALNATDGTTTNNTFTLANGDVISVKVKNLATPTGAASLARVMDVAEYGPQNFFVTGLTNDGAGNLTLQNWWEFAVLTAFVGFAPLVSGQKMYRVHGANLYFSGVGDPSATNYYLSDNVTVNTANPGAGFIDTSRIDSDSLYLIGMEAYYKQVAVFSRRVCLLFTLDPDLANNTFQQLLRIGAVSNGSILQFGTGDVLFLSDTGVRSLRVLNASLAAGVTDVGSPIDEIIKAAIAANSSTAIYAPAIIEPLTGRYWLAIGNTIYVLSYWPSAHINAWTTFTLPFNVDQMTTAGTMVFIRSGDTIYLYGGLDGATYDDCAATVVTPYASAETPTTVKKAISISAMVQGNWAVSVNMDPGSPYVFELAANLTGPTYALQKIGFAGAGTHIQFKMTCSDAAPSLLGAVSVQFQKVEER